MRAPSLAALLVLALHGCAHPRATGDLTSRRESDEAAAKRLTGPAVTFLADAGAALALAAPDAGEALAEAGLAADDEDDELATSEEPVAEEGEAHEEASASVDAGFLFTGELADDVLAQLWKESPEKLGSISIGFVDEGRLVNAKQIQAEQGSVVPLPDKAWATEETAAYLSAVVKRMRTLYPGAFPLRINQISSKEGGHLRPHKSHQNGRDVDLGFYYPTAEPIRAREREKYIDAKLNWELVKSVAALTDAQFILVDRRVQKVLYDYAISAGEDPQWVDSLFKGPNPLVKHARRHRDHFHVRFFSPRSQELGRRVAPLLAERPEQNILMHRVRSGDTLGHIAMKYGTTVAMLKKGNRLSSSFLRLGQVLKVQLRGPCNRCPVPPPAEIPARRTPPGFSTGDAETTTGAGR